MLQFRIANLFPMQAHPSAARRNFKSFFPATCAAGKIPLAERASNRPPKADDRGAERSASRKKPWLFSEHRNSRPNSRGKPAKRLAREEEEQRSERAFAARRKRRIRSLLRRFGGVPVSTGVWRQDQRADAPDILKTGNYKLKNNNEFAVAA